MERVLFCVLLFVIDKTIGQMIGKYYFNKTIHGFKLSAKRERRIQIEFVS